MYLQQVLADHHGCASYLIADTTTGQAAIVDPAIDTSPYEHVLAERGYTLRAIIDTHTHADHVSGARTLAAAHDAPIYLHRNARVAYPFTALDDRDQVTLGDIRIEAFHTPGHRAEMMSLLLTDPIRSDRPIAVLTGDSLLAGDAGRPDFGGGDAEAQYRSIQRLLSLDDWVMVLPGHFEGPCGGALNGMAVSTIGYERRFSPISVMNRERFIDYLTGAVPPRPLNMTAIEATNRGLIDAAWAMPADRSTIVGLAPHEVAARQDALLLDVREPAEYRAAHIPGAVNVPPCDLASRIEELPRDREIVVICQAGRRSRRAGSFLADRGFPRIVNLDGGTDAWLAAGLAIDSGDPTHTAGLLASAR
jgi:glyoxylase-like metal-dependent hydrolase (beta-lactamase superfamily II)/rhodanese-related sulfurtransferase